MQVSQSDQRIKTGWFAAKNIMCQLAAFQTGNWKWMGGEINELRILSIPFIYCLIIEYIRLSDCPEIVERLMNVAR